MTASVPPILLLTGAAPGDRQIVQALQADERVRPRPFSAFGELLDGVQGAPPPVPLAVFCPGVEHAVQRSRELLHAVPEAFLVLLQERGDRRTLLERFRNVPVDARRVELVRLEGDYPGRLLAIARGAAGRHRHQERLRRGLARMAQLNPQPLDWAAGGLRRQVHEALPVGLIVLTPDGFVLEVNSAARTLLDDAAAVDPVGPERVADLIPEWPQLDLVPPPAERTIARGPAEARRQLRISSAVVGEPSAPRALVLTLEDVTEREAARQQLKRRALELEFRLAQGARERDQARSQRDYIKHFIAALCHDLRNPLGGALINSQLLRRRVGAAISEPTVALLEQIERSLRRADRMIQDLLDMSRSEASAGLSIEPAPARLDRLVQEAVRDAKTFYNRQFDTGEAPAPIEGVWDSDGLRRILDNLLSNAVKYGDPSRPIRVEAREDAAGVVLEVHNYGPAIPAEAHESLFDPYYRAKAARGSRLPGWGIGLAFVRAMAEAHGGSVAVSSSERDGTRFSVRLPKHPFTDSQAAQR